LQRWKNARSVQQLI